MVSAGGFRSAVGRHFIEAHCFSVPIILGSLTAPICLGFFRLVLRRNDSVGGGRKYRRRRWFGSFDVCAIIQQWGKLERWGSGSVFSSRLLRKLERLDNRVHFFIKLSVL